jgi:hypothetical protein
VVVHTTILPPSEGSGQSRQYVVTRAITRLV